MVAPVVRLNASRRRWLQDELAVHGSVVAADAAAQLGVSVDSIRRDLNALADAGVARRVHGGAVAHPYSHPDPVFSDSATKRAMSSMCPSVSSPTIPSPSHKTLFTPR